MVEDAEKTLPVAAEREGRHPTLHRRTARQEAFRDRTLRDTCVLRAFRGIGETPVQRPRVQSTGRYHGHGRCSFLRFVSMSPSAEFELPQDGDLGPPSEGPPDDPAFRLDYEPLFAR